MLRRIILLMLAVLIIIQLFHSKQNIREEEPIKDNNIETVLAVPSEVSGILLYSCYDCHSNNTDYPWYAEIQPIDWWINRHIREGKKELNFDEFAAYSARRQYKKLEEINEVVQEGEMPLKAYTLIHKEAKLSEAQKRSIATWVSTSLEYMKSIHSPDSLLRKNK